MGTFSAVHWIIFIAMVAALVAFLYFVGSLLWAGAKVKGKGRLIVAAVLLPVAVLALASLFSSTNGKAPEAGPSVEYWKKGSTPIN